MSLHNLRGELRVAEPMLRHTTWRVGGPTDRYYKPADQADLADFIQRLPADEALLWLGLGSNLLVRDAGFRGTTVCVHGVLDHIEDLGDGRLRVEAGAHCARLAKRTAQLGLAGGEFFAGIPGTVGGALAMNAGAWGSETWDFVDQVWLMDCRGTVVNKAACDFNWGYDENLY